MTYSLGKGTLKFINNKYVPHKRYSVSDEGYIFDNVKKKILNDYDNGNGYRIVGIYSPGTKKAKMFYVHRLVGEYFIDNPRSLPFINHKDGNRANNNSSNLEWVSASQNTRHGIALGSVNRIGRSSRSYTQMPTENIQEAVKHFCSGESIRSSAELVGSVRATLSSIFNGRSRVKEAINAFEIHSCKKCKCVDYLNNLKKIS